MLIYFEVNPKLDYWTYIRENSKDTNWLRDFEQNVKINHQDQIYNLKVFYVGLPESDS